MIREIATDDNFNEELYLLANPDVSDAVKRGVIDSGISHFNKFGKAERRKTLVQGEDFIASFSNKVRKGRNIYEGYQRGWGLQFGTLSLDIEFDKLYKEACEVATIKTIVSEYNRKNIFILLRDYLKNIPFGHIIEFGSYKGGNAIFMAYIVNKLYPGMKVFALDSYTGIPDTDKSIDLHNSGDFRDTNISCLKEYAECKGINNIEIVKGLFESTAEDTLRLAKNISLAYIDCDVYSSVKYSYEVVKPFMVQDGYLVFDDGTVSSCIGATEAIEEFVIKRDGLYSEQIFPQYVFRFKPCKL